MSNIELTNPGFPLEIRSYEIELSKWLDHYILNRKPGSPYLPTPKLAVYGRDYEKFLHVSPPPDTTATDGVLCLTEPFTGSYLELYTAGIRHIVYRNCPMAEESMNLALFSTQHPGSFLEDPCRYSDPNLVRNIRTIADSTDALTAAEKLLVENSFGEAKSHAIRLCLKEAITNAIFHGFRQTGTQDRKYVPENFHQIEDPDKVSLCLSLTDGWLIAVIKDNSGILGPLRVANSLDRHHTDRGLMDERGRGFYLMHQLAQRMIVSLRRQQETSITLYFSPEESVNKTHHLQLLLDD